MSSDIVKRKSNGSTQVNPNKIAKIKSNEKALAISPSRTTSSAQKSNIDVKSTTQDDEGTSEETSDRISDEERHNEIDNINEGSFEDALGRYNLSSKKDIDPCSENFLISPILTKNMIQNEKQEQKWLNRVS